MSLTKSPRYGVTPQAAQPAPPSRLYSFTGWQASNPTAPPPGDRMDADYDNTNTALTQTLSWAAVSLNTDGTLKAGSVGQSQMVSGLFDDIAQDIIAEVQPLVDQASGSATSAWAASTAAQASATAADRSNTAAGGAATTATTAANTATAAQSTAQGYATTASTAATNAHNSDNDAQAAAALAQDYADVTQAWAEHMPDPIPPNILAVMGITGDHWSSRWWANQSAQTFGGRQLMQSLLYRASANQTVFPLTRPDLGGRTYEIFSIEPVDVFVNGVRLPGDDPNPGNGDWTLNAANSTVTFLTPLLAGSMVQIDVMSPAISALSGAYLPLSSVYTAPAVSSDMAPARHLSNLIGKTSAVVCIIGDSTGTDGPVQVSTVGGAITANGVDQSQMLWAALCDKLRTDNPQITTWSFLNFAIGGTAENAPPLTGTALAVDQSVYPWFTNLSQTWLSYVQAAQPDVLFYLFGTNSSAAGTGTAGAGASTFITANLQAIDAWTYTPNVVIVTNKTSTPADTTAGPDDLNSSNHLGQASFHRTFARSCAAGYTAFPKCQAKGFGLVDLGRYAAARLYGYDPAAQYMRAVPSAIATGLPLAFADTGVENAATIGKSTHGDFRLTFVLRGQGGTILSGYGFSAIRVGMSNFDGNYVRITVEPGGVGTVRARYTIDGATAAAPMQSGTLVTTTTGQDVTITVSASGPHIRVWVNGTLSLNILAARFVTPVYGGGCPINVGVTSAPTGTPTFDVTEFYEGVGAPTPVTTTYDKAFGTRVSGSGLIDSYAGGNSINHQTSLHETFDRHVINSLDFRVPQSIPLPGGAALPVNAANDAAAASAGVNIGSVYRIGTALQVRTV